MGSWPDRLALKGDTAMKSSHTRNVNWPFVTFWLIYLSIIFSVGYVML